MDWHGGPRFNMRGVVEDPDHIRYGNTRNDLKGVYNPRTQRGVLLQALLQVLQVQVVANVVQLHRNPEYTNKKGCEYGDDFTAEEYQRDYQG